MNRRKFLAWISALPWFLRPVKADFNLNPGPTYPKTLEELTEFMERTLPVGPSTIYNKSVTGEEYIEYVIACTVPNKQEIAKMCRWQWNTFLKLVRNTPDAKLYWRVKPEYSEWDIRAKIYIRYLVSNKPIIPEIK